MRLRELTGFKKEPVYQMLRNSSDIFQFINKIVNSGYKKYFVGRGSYAGVFAKEDDPYVIKIFNVDPGYEKFLTYALANQSNPHVPRIKGQLINFNNYKILRIERLRKSSTDTDYNIIELITNYIFSHNYKFSSYSAANKIELEEMYPQIIPVLDELAKNKTNLDISSNNIMFRGSVPVITDPYMDRDFT